jgi:hypothetical protein
MDAPVRVLIQLAEGVYVTRSDAFDQLIVLFEHGTHPVPL